MHVHLAHMSELANLFKARTDNQFQVPVTGTGSRLPETGQCVLSSGSRFLPVPVSVSLVPAAGKR